MILKILNELAADNSRLAKEAILKREKNNQLLKDTFKAAYDPFINYWIKKIPPYKCREDQGLDWALKSLYPLVSREYTGNKGIEYFGALLSCINADDAEVIERVIERDLKCGVGIPTINKIWPGLIPTFDVMLAHSDTSGIKYPAYAQVKKDGMRCHLHYDGKKATAWSRNGKQIELLGKFDSYAKGVMQSGQTFDGEIVFYKNGKPLDRKTSNGLGNKAIRGTISEVEAEMARFCVWDNVDFTSKKPYKDRLQNLMDVLEFEFDLDCNIGENKFFIVETVEVNNEKEATDFYNKCISNGEEGAVLKNINSVWVPRRTKDLGKIKAEEEADLVVVGWKEGKGKFIGQVGALDCETSDGIVSVNVSGFTDDVRLTLGDSTIDKIITVRYNQKIQDKFTGKWSLFLPRFVCFREDKDVANSFEELK